MDLDLIFNSASKKLLPKDEVRLKEDPAHLILVFQEFIVNWYKYCDKLIPIIQNSNEEFDEDDSLTAGKYIFFNKAFTFLEKLDLNNVIHKTELLNYNNTSFHLALEMSIYFFESYEEFEKCKIIKKFLDFLESSPL